MTNWTLAGQYADRFDKYGACEENIHQTRALCHIADMLTNIACDIRVLREHISSDEGDEV